jgi:histidinol phosphatase-like PHP family hydrolase
MKVRKINMYVASLTSLSYEILAVGKTESECKQNMVKGFENYVKSYHSSVDEWISGLGEDLSDYENDVFTFLQQYYAVHMFDITKGYALGWE